MTLQNIWVSAAVAAIVLSACSATDDSAKAPEVISEANNATETVEIALSDVLDGVTSNYCIDIAGGNKDIDISKGLQAHTCYTYRGEVGTDQKFTRSRFANNQLYMTDFDVCATVAALKAGSTIGLAACDGSDLQNITFSGSGTIFMTGSPDLCFTAAKDSRYGRSKVHQIKALLLENCSAELAAYQEWHGRSSSE